MVKLYEDGIYLRGGSEVVPAAEAAERGITQAPEDAKRGTIAYSILQAHNTSGDPEALKIRFDAMASHDITFVGIIQTARASGMEQFPLPYVLTNCHNSLCAVGGTINEDDHVFGLSAAKKYGGIFVPPHIAVIHSFMRENFAGCGKMILGSDSHTRYGALGTMAVGEGGGELAKQLLRDTYDVAYPGVVAIYLTGAPRPGVGPHDVALAIIRAVFAKGYVKNKVMEFVGPGIASMTTDYRNGVDVMTTETTCLSSIWATDEDTHAFLTMHGRGDDYRELKPADVAYYDGCVEVDLSSIKPMIALPFHPSNGFEIEELNENLEDILHEVELEAAKIGEGKTHFSLLDKIVDGKLHVQQGVIAGLGVQLHLLFRKQLAGVAGVAAPHLHVDEEQVFLLLLHRLPDVLRVAGVGVEAAAGQHAAHLIGGVVLVGQAGGRGAGQQHMVGRLIDHLTAVLALLEGDACPGEGAVQQDVDLVEGEPAA